MPDDNQDIVLNQAAEYIDVGKLKREGKLIRIGPVKGGHWEVIEKQQK